MNLGTRVAIIGCPGSGKSTLAARLAEYTKLPIIHLDRHYHGPNWQEMEKSKWERKHAELIAKPSWVIDGNYLGTMDERITEADSIIYLDYNRCICMYRAISRIYKYRNRTRPDVAEECVERFDWPFMRFIWNFNRLSKPNIYQLIEKQTNKNIIILKSPREAAKFRKSLQ